MIEKSKEGGLDTIETYVFWNAHEPVRGHYDFTGNNDLIRFLKTIQQKGLYAVLRIGPYVCAEWHYGGIPVWVHNLPGVEIRTANKVFMNEMQNFTTLIVNMIKEEKLFASQGGPIIIAQIENEYGNVMAPYGDAGKAYIDWCAKMAGSLDIGVPWIMCQQSDAPPPMNWGGRQPHRTPEDIAYAVARFYQTGGTFQNYYMYHGGTNFGRTAGGPYITTSYDYDAPLDEYGNIAQPKWGHLKQLHKTLKSMEKSLTYGNVSQIDLGNSVNATVYATNESSSCFLSNTNTSSDATVTFRGKQFTVPAWSVSLLPDCQNEQYNTAKVNVQTSVMVHRPNKAEEQPKSLKWVWKAENINDALHAKSHFLLSANTLFDQKFVTSDSTDYLWYITKLHLDKKDPIWSDDMSLRINGCGHVIYAFVNGQHIGSHWPTNGNPDNYEIKIKLKQGNNIISLLSVTVGLQNYGAFYDKGPSGLVGPIEVIGRKGDETIIKDLSSHKWSYKIGLDGWKNNLFNENSTSKWVSHQLPTNKSFTWYKTTFKAPLGNDPVVVNLEGMGKGYGWVNGHNIGRYWPSFLAEEDGCSDAPCDYRGQYSSTKCVSNCGKPTQTWYHVPRSFLRDDGNTLVLFEEIGGNPFYVNFQTVNVGSICGNAYENNTLELSCHGTSISAIKFASFGNPQGLCGAFSKGTCESINNALSVLQKACVRKETCSIDVSEKTFGSTSCGDIAKRLAVEAVFVAVAITSLHDPLAAADDETASFRQTALAAATTSSSSLVGNSRSVVGVLLDALDLLRIGFGLADMFWAFIIGPEPAVCELLGLVVR
ncbi:beta-galactosidase 15-like [Senna tora]|uniref:Beta-galactosidase n=1 Tax=Senna tora TaxID=362788 RepID=A0A834W1Z5_9FABA|nr:beta-galactosidase 15-like [Senna tora]